MRRFLLILGQGWVSLSLLFSFESSQFASFRVVPIQELKKAIQSAVLANRLPQLKEYILKNPSQFEELDIAGVYLEVATNYYGQKNFFLALMVATEGYFMRGKNESRALCAYYASRILYQQDNRESALFYINRALENLPTDHSLYHSVKRLKRQIRWEYLSRTEGLPDESVSDICFDGDDVWFSMWTGGIGRFTRSSLSVVLFSQKKGGLKSDHTRTMALEGDILWVGTYGGLCFYNKTTGKWQNVPGELSTVPIKKLFLHENGLYVATLGKGLFLGKKGSFQRIFFSSLYVSDVLHVGEWMLIATMDNGVYVFRGEKPVARILPGKTVKSLALYKGKIYGGTHGEGMFVVTPGEWEKIQWISGLSSPYVETLQVYREVLVIGTLGGGVNFLYPNGEIRVLTILDGLSSNDVVRIRPEKNRLWFGTLSGGIAILLVETMEDI
ncbi:MAG: hypothetical protein N2314_04160 [Brevinematales bacterium]|nr:hypothetical protein [Brevinematales bacterium]